jgi:3'-5' exonuclease
MLQYWKFEDFNSYTLLSLLTTILRVSPKKTILADPVRQVYFEEMNLPRMAAYCLKAEVSVTIVIFRFRNLRLSKPENIFVAEKLKCYFTLFL